VLLKGRGLRSWLRFEADTELLEDDAQCLEEVTLGICAIHTPVADCCQLVRVLQTFGGLWLCPDVLLGTPSQVTGECTLPFGWEAIREAYCSLLSLTATNGPIIGLGLNCLGRVGPKTTIRTF